MKLMELEECIKILKKLQQDMSSYNDFMVGEFGEKQILAIQTVLNYIKEESISRVVVQEKIEEYKKVDNNNYYDYNADDIVDILQELLNKGEK